MPDDASTATPSDHTLAAELAGAAGDLLLRFRRQNSEDADLSRRADLASNEYLIRELRRARPDDAILSEESPDDGRRFTADRCWIIDPLDGSREFGELARCDWAVHVALVHHGAVIAAAVSVPARDILLSTSGQESGAPARTTGPSPIRIAVSRTRPPGIASNAARALDAQIVEMGSAGAKTAAVIVGDVDAYIHAGGQREWDAAAPVGVAHHAGLHVSRLDGSALVFNKPNPSVPDFVICRRDIADRVLESVAVDSPRN